MTLAWPNIRYWSAFCASLLFALIAFSGLGMGGPRDAIGWTVFLLCLAAPIVVWWTRSNRAGPWLQYAMLAIVLLTIVYVAVFEN